MRTFSFNDGSKTVEFEYTDAWWLFLVLKELFNLFKTNSTVIQELLKGLDSTGLSKDEMKRLLAGLFDSRKFSQQMLKNIKKYPSYDLRTNGTANALVIFKELIKDGLENIDTPELEAPSNESPDQGIKIVNTCEELDKAMSIIRAMYGEYKSK
jgi:hypothetical protein